MTRVIAIFICCMLLPFSAFGASFEDPWSKGPGFADPFAKGQDSQPARKREPGKNPQERKGSTGAESPKAAQPGQAQPERGFSKPIIGDRPRTPAPARRNPEGDEYEAGEQPENGDSAWIAPFGIQVGDSFDAARSLVGSLGFATLGKCGNGELFVFDPAGMCAALLVNEKTVNDSRLVSGGAFRLSRNCLADDAGYAPWGAWLAERGRDSGEAIEYADNSSSPAACPNFAATLDSGSLPKFLGFLTGAMDRRMADSALAAMGARKTRDFSNGASYDLAGTTVYCEFCPATGEAVAYSLKVEREDPRARAFIDRMNVRRTPLLFENARVRSEIRNGKVMKMEMAFPQAAERCGKTG